jgi:two-component system chemotaxis response regulator CheB
MRSESTPRARVLIVDDSVAMRRIIARVVAADPALEVVGEAATATQARDEVLRLSPDVITLDLNLPGMGGLEFLERLMRHRPTPVVVITGSEDDAQSSLETAVFERGAAAMIPKVHEGYSARDFSRDTLRALRAAAGLPEVAPPAHAAPPSDPRPSRGLELIALGASTGGTEALTQVFQRFERPLPPMVITQHMPEHFTRSFAARLDRVGVVRVHEAAHGQPLLPGHALLAPGGQHLSVKRAGDQLIAQLSGDDKVNGHRPSVDVLFHSAARVVGARCAAALLTGMGDDGARGLKSLRDGGAYTIAQDEATSVVWGMPRVAAALGGAVNVLPLEAIAAHLEVASLGLGHPTPALVRRHTQSGLRRESRLSQG